MKIEFDAAIAKVSNVKQEERNAVIAVAQALTFVDKNIFYQNQKRPRHLQLNPNRCLFDHVTKSFPTGLLTKAVTQLYNLDIQPEVINNISAVMHTPWSLPDSAWEHQRDIVDKALMYRRGIIKSPTGSGKTRSAGFLIRQFPKSRVIFTVPTKDLLHSSAKAISEVIEEPVGKVGDDLLDWKRVTVGIINSLANQAEKNPAQYEDVEVLLMDECHRAGSDYYVTVGNACKNTDVRLGLSATPWRGTGDDMVMEGVLGPIVLGISENVMIHLGVTTPIEYHFIECPDPNYKYAEAVQQFKPNGEVYYTYPTPDGRPDQKEVYELALVNNPSRNELVIKAAVSFLESSYPFPGAILVDRIEHGELLKEMLAKQGYPDIPFVQGKTKDRQSIYDAMGKEYRLMIATSGVIKEGIDIPCLGVGFNAGGGSTSGKLIQQIGRFCRGFPGKQKTIMIDILDQERFYLSRAAAKRLEAVEKTYPRSTRQVLVESLPNLFV